MIKNNYLIRLNTILCVSTLLFSTLYYLINNQEKVLYKIENDPGRNEGSTPRTFVLPASPPVVVEQERKQSLLARKSEIQKCMFKLYDRGYKDLGSFDDIFDFKVTVALINFQRANNIEVSGEFGNETMQKLGCNEK